MPPALCETARLGDPGEGSEWILEEPRTKAWNFTPFTPFEGFLKKRSISGRFAVVRMHRHGRICSLFSNEVELPKLNVAGSIPVSRSMFSIAYVGLHFGPMPENGVIGVSRS
ncbi:MAG: hypothetical protein QM757_25925 [Paludibaculum sp.]